jgi:hypothetical protein
MQENSTLLSDQNPNEETQNQETTVQETVSTETSSQDIKAELPSSESSEEVSTLPDHSESNSEPELDISPDTVTSPAESSDLAEAQLESSEMSEAQVTEEPSKELEPNSEVFVEEMNSLSEETDVEVETLPETVVGEVKSEAVTEAEPQVEMLVVEEHELEELENHEAEIHLEDYSGLDLEQLVKLAEQLNRDSDPVTSHRVIQKIRPLFDALYQHDKNEAFEKFVGEGNDKDSFEFKNHNLEVRFFQAIKGINEKRKLNQEFQTKERAKNLESKLTLLEQLRQLVDDHEHTPGYDKFKQIREDWKKIGPVGPEHAQNLNASFYSLIERFYSLSEIYHNLKDFDRKKNLELKLELVGKIEKLADEPSMARAMKDLMSYQDEYRSLGPVPKERFEEIKERLKKAVDVLYEKRKEFNEQRKKWLAEEISAKEVLVEKVAEFENFASDQIKEWQAKTKELLALQEEWKAIPGKFREKTTDLNKKFWTVYKKYMHNKNEFFKNLDKGKKDLLSQKRALVDEVNSLKEGEDWDGIVNRMKELQAEWKNLPPVFGKEGQKIYEAFKSGIDHFFTRLRDRRSGEDKEQRANLEKKENLCKEIEEAAEKGIGTREMVEGFKESFKNMGFVPTKLIQKINSRFTRAIMDLVDKSTLIPKEEKEKYKINLLNSNKSVFAAEGVKSLKNQEGYIKNRLQQLKRDLGNLEDNVSMFKMSKNAMALIEDVQKRINLIKLEIKELESQLKEIRAGE